MTKQAVAGLESDYDAILALAGTFTAEEWARPSSCSGWRVQDVIAHLSATFQSLVDRGSLPETPPDEPVERQQDRFVDSLRGLSSAEILDRYRVLGEQAIIVLAGLQDNDAVVPVGGLGSYPLHLVANAFTFDHYTHLRSDLLKPFGPLDRSAPEAGDDHLGAVVDWMIAGLPQMSAEALGRLTSTVNLVLDGPGARAVTFRCTDGGVDVADGQADDADATVTSSTADYVRWGTGRASWRDAVRIEGDADAAAAFCDAAHVF
ncbi:MAG: hypothetical protein QOG03_2431 [Actinomycetota bacterium]|jgi:uncharacterized protein (TIGR03083 family)|nr:hypothetical protein [Actinomycetota bacterium]